MDAQTKSCANSTKNPEINKYLQNSDLWTDGLICAFEFIRAGSTISRTSSLVPPTKQTSTLTLKKYTSLDSGSLIDLKSDEYEGPKQNPKFPNFFSENYWAPIGWHRISELVREVRTGTGWDSAEIINLIQDEDELTVADVAAPYFERPAGPIWWCHMAAGHQAVDSWLGNASWLHPAICIALRDESRLISDKMKHLLYEVPVRVAGGLLFELLGQSVGDPEKDEEDVPVVLRSFQAQNFLITALHVKGPVVINVNCLGITEVQELLLVGGSLAPKHIHEVVAHLASRLARWDDRLWRKYVFGAADEIELKFVNRRNHEDLNMLCLIFNQEIRRLATQVIRVKWSLHAREEIIFELIQHLRGHVSKQILERIKKDTRAMIEEQEAVRARLFTIQDVMQSTVRAWLQDRSLRVTHNLTIFGGCGLILSIITSLFGINVDGIPGAESCPYAFLIFTIFLFILGLILIGLGIIYLGLQNPISEQQVQVRKLELQQLVDMFQHEAETHAKVREGVSRHNLPPRAADLIHEKYDLLIP
ncbi:hypothetical protein LUZ60_008517 [Juncus effusus]|nr:hypothetical protein LUZ60_008517 [Juncus effusus]